MWDVSYTTPNFKPHFLVEITPLKDRLQYKLYSSFSFKQIVFEGFVMIVMFVAISDYFYAINVC